MHVQLNIKVLLSVKCKRKSKDFKNFYDPSRNISQDKLLSHFFADTRNLMTRIVYLT